MTYLTFKLGINTQVIGKTQAHLVSRPGAFRAVSTNFSGLAKHIGKGHPWMPVVLDEGKPRWQVHANYTELLANDIDAGWTIEEALQHPFVKAHCGLGIESASSKPEWHKFRLVFRLAQPVIGHKQIKLCNRYLISLFDHADKACKDASRFFFGALGKTPFLLNEKATLPVDFLERAIAWDTENKRNAELKKAEARANRIAIESETIGESNGEITEELVKSALNCIPEREPGSGTYQESVSVLFALYNQFGEEKAIELAEEWSPSFGTWDVEKKIRGFGNTTTDNPITIGTLFHIARKHGFKFQKPEMNREQERKWNRDRIRERAFKLFFERTALKADIAKRCKHVNLAGFPLPQLGEALLVSAFTGAGKSTFFKEVKDQLINDCDAPVMTDLIGHRNALMRITGKQMGMQHISDLIGEDLKTTQQRIKQVDSLAYCIDSFLKRVDALMTHIGMGGKVLITGDELNALVDHMVMGGTIKGDKRPRIIAAFSALLQAIADGNGWFIGGESCLTPITINAIKAFSNGKLKITTCQLTNGNPNPWKVYDYFYPVATKAKHAAFHKVRELLKQGKKVIFAIGSQEGGEQFAKLLSKWNVKLVDRWSNSDEDTREFVKSINESLPDSGIDCLIHTPSLGIGVSIEAEYFDAVVVYSAKLSPFNAIQLAGRVRKAVDRYMFIPDFSEGGIEFDPSKIVVEWEEGLEKAFNRHNSDHIQRRGVIGAATKIRAELEALNNIGSQATHDITLEILKRDGHHIIECEPLPKDELDELKREFKAVKEAIEDERLEDWKKAPLLRDLETAKKTLKRDDLNRGQWTSATKTIAFDTYGEMALSNDEFIREMYCQGKKSDGYRAKAHAASKHEYPETAIAVEKEMIANSLDRNGTLFAPDFKSEVEAIELLAKLGFQQFISSLADDKYTNKNDALLTFFESAKAYKVEVKKILGQTITDKTQPIAFVNDLLKKKFFCEIESHKKREAKKGDPLREHIDQDTICSLSGSLNKKGVVTEYFITKFPNRDAILERLNQNTLKWIEQSQEERRLKEEQLELQPQSLPRYVVADDSFKLVDEFNGTTTKTVDSSPVPVRVRAIA